MATLCVKYLALERFSDLHSPENHELVAVGNYAFQEYATLNWIYHSETLFNLEGVNDAKDLSSLEKYCLLLLSRHGEMPPTQLEMLSSGPAKQGDLDLKTGLSRIKDAYEAVNSIAYERDSEGKICYSQYRDL